MGFGLLNHKVNANNLQMPQNICCVRLLTAIVYFSFVKTACFQMVIQYFLAQMTRLADFLICAQIASSMFIVTSIGLTVP